MVQRDVRAPDRFVSPHALTRIPTVRRAQELVDTAFHKASKVSAPGKDATERTRATELGRVRSIQNSLDATLGTYVRRFPTLERLPPFYRDLVDLLVDVDRLRKALGAIDWARKRINQIGDEAVAEMKEARRVDFIHAARKRVYGRVASVLEQVDGDLALLNEARNGVRRVPMIETEHPTIVVAGFPNVGKSSLIREVSTAAPEVASYPFTTKGVTIGHFEHDHLRYQIVDTPGLLDRDLAERNDIERQAILALQHLADVILVILDPSEYCGYPMADQLRLLDDVRDAFPETPVLVAENKVDVKRPEATAGRHQISTETGEGLDELMDAVIAAIGEPEEG